MMYVGDDLMKNLVFTCSIFALGACFFSFWYADVLFDRFFVLGILPLLFSVLFLALNLMISIVFVVRNPSEVKYYGSLCIALITIVLLFSFPFRLAKVNLELWLFDTKRNQVIEMVKNLEIIPDQFGNAELPFLYAHTSSDGNIHVYRNDDEQVVSFWVFRGMLSGSVELIYSSMDETLVYEIENGSFIIGVEKLKEHWYLVNTD